MQNKKSIVLFFLISFGLFVIGAIALLRLTHRPDTSTITLPPAPDRNGYTLLKTGDTTLVLRPTPKSPLSAAQECLALIRTCYTNELKDINACFSKVKICNTDTPWLEKSACCPSTCGARYQTLRSQGKNDIVASGEAIIRSPSCIPGLDDQLKK